METISLSHFADSRGSLTVIEKIIPFPIKRVFFLHDVPEALTRGGHGHFKTRMAVVAVSGSVRVRVNNGLTKSIIELNKLESVLILEPEDWHLLFDFSADCVVAVLASEEYDKSDYFYSEPM